MAKISLKEFKEACEVAGELGPSNNICKVGEMEIEFEPELPGGQSMTIATLSEGDGTDIFYSFEPIRIEGTDYDEEVGADGLIMYSDNFEYVANSTNVMSITER